MKELELNEISQISGGDCMSIWAVGGGIAGGVIGGVVWEQLLIPTLDTGKLTGTR